MTDRLTRNRSWIALLYGLAVVMAQGFHDHHGAVLAVERHGEVGSCGAGHHEPGNDEFERPDPSGLSSCSNECPACEFILSHQASLADQAVGSDEGRCAFLSGLSRSEPRPSCCVPRSRAPPLC